MGFNDGMMIDFFFHVPAGHMSMCMCQQPLLRTLDEIVV